MIDGIGIGMGTGCLVGVRAYTRCVGIVTPYHVTVAALSLRSVSNRTPRDLVKKPKAVQATS